MFCDFGHQWQKDLRFSLGNRWKSGCLLGQKQPFFPISIETAGTTEARYVFEQSYPSFCRFSAQEAVNSILGPKMTEVEQHHQFLTAVGIFRWFSVWYQWSKEAWMENKVITHTCSEQSLRILMWNASYVQKTLQLTWQERVDDTIRERLKSNPCLVTARSNWSIWTKSFSLYWQLRNTDCDNSAVKRETLQKIDMPVLGLAGCHWRQNGNWRMISPDITISNILKPPSSLGSGWNEIHCPPAWNRIKSNKISSRSFTSFQMVRTHTRSFANSTTHTWHHNPLVHSN